VCSRRKWCILYARMEVTGDYAGLLLATWTSRCTCIYVHKLYLVQVNKIEGCDCKTFGEIRNRMIVRMISFVVYTTHCHSQHFVPSSAHPLESKGTQDRRDFHQQRTEDSQCRPLNTPSSQCLCRIFGVLACDDMDDWIHCFRFVRWIGVLG